MSEYGSNPKRETYPLVSSDDTLVMVFRDHHVSTNRPVLYVKALTGGVSIRVDSGTDLDTELFTPGSVQTLSLDEVLMVELPTGSFVPTNKVCVLNVLGGRVSADLRSPNEVRTYLRQPGQAFGTATLSGNTGTSGGWPSSPNPPAP